MFAYDFQRLAVLAVVSLLAGGAPACQDDNPRQGPSKGSDEARDAGLADGRAETPSSTAVREFGRKIREAQCRRIFECCSAEERNREFDIRSDSPDAGCASSNTLGSLFSLQRYDDAIDEGRLRYNEGFAELCLESHRNRECSNLGDVPPFSRDLPGCASMLEPLVDRGDECASDRECRTGFCALSTDEDSVCRPLPEKGETCPNSRCKRGLYCDAFQAEPTCKPKKSVGSDCDADAECRSGLCRSDRCVDPTPACDNDS